jgi:hypothetical protein
MMHLTGDGAKRLQFVEHGTGDWGRAWPGCFGDRGSHMRFRYVYVMYLHLAIRAMRVSMNAMMRQVLGIGATMQS